MKVRETCFGLLLCVSVGGCPMTALREELLAKNNQIESLNTQLRTTQASLDSSKESLAKASERRRYEEGLMKGLSSHLRRLLKYIDSGFTPQPEDLRLGPDSASDQPPAAPPPSPPISKAP